MATQIEKQPHPQPTSGTGAGQLPSVTGAEDNTTPPTPIDILEVETPTTTSPPSPSNPSLEHSKSAYLVLAGCVLIQAPIWGYSLAFSSTATNGFIGNLHNFGMRRVLADPSPGSPLIPELLYSFYQMEFACVTVAILVGALAERGRVMPALVFCFLWMTLVYCPLACWAWAPNGWAFKWGVLDYAGLSLAVA